MKETVSIALCTYNGMNYLEEQLNSLLFQTLQPDQVVIRDDGSTDGTVEFVRGYIKEHELSGWSFAKNESNLGFGENFHRAILDCDGDLVFCCDQDDVWAPDKLEICCKVMACHPEVQLLCHEYDVLRCDGTSRKLPKTIANCMRSDGSLEHIPAHNGGVFIWIGCCMVARKAFLDQIEGYRFEGWAHDEWMWKCAQALDGCYMFHKPLITYRLHTSNTTGAKFHEPNKRIAHVEEKMEGDEQALKLAKDNEADKGIVNIFRRATKCGELRLGLLADKKLTNAALLLFYLDAYPAKRAWLVELKMVATSRV